MSNKSWSAPASTHAPVLCYVAGLPFQKVLGPQQAPNVVPQFVIRHQQSLVACPHCRVHPVPVRASTLSMMATRASAARHKDAQSSFLVMPSLSKVGLRQCRIARLNISHVPSIRLDGCSFTSHFTLIWCILYFALRECLVQYQWYC